MFPFFQMSQAWNISSWFSLLKVKAFAFSGDKNIEGCNILWVYVCGLRFFQGIRWPQSLSNSCCYLPLHYKVFVERLHIFRNRSTWHEERSMCHVHIDICQFLFLCLSFGDFSRSLLLRIWLILKAFLGHSSLCRLNKIISNFSKSKSTAWWKVPLAQINE